MKQATIFIVLLSIFTETSGQIKLSSNVKAKYDSIYMEFYPSFRKKVERNEKKGAFDGLAIIEFYKIDTLNKEERIPDSILYPGFVKVESLLPILKISAGPNDKGGFFPTATISNDTLYLFMEQGLNTILVGGKIINSFCEDSQYDTSYNRLPDIKRPVEIFSFIISSVKYKPGQILYGEVDFEKLPYYKQNSGFKSGLLHERIYCKFVFKVKVKAK